MKLQIKITSITALIIVLLSLPLIFLLQRDIVDTKINIVSYSLALIAYVSWLWAILLTSRWPWLLRQMQVLGPGSVIQSHKVVGPISIVLALVHYIMSFSMHEKIVYTGIGGGIVISIAILAMWQLKPSTMRRWLHRGAILGVILILAHVHLSNRIAVITPFMMLFDAYTVAVVGLYMWKRYLK